MGRFPKPCIKCGVLTTGGSYCISHQKEKWNRYNDPRYRYARQQIKATAIRCHICQELFTDRNDISADHLIPGDLNSPLLAAHIRCNSRRGDTPLWQSQNKYQSLKQQHHHQTASLHPSNDGDFMGAGHFCFNFFCKEHPATFLRVCEFGKLSW